MRKLALSLGGLFLLAAAAVTLLATQPWSPYSPLAMFTLFDPEERVENFRHMDRIFPYQRIDAGEQAHTFPRAERPLDIDYRFDGKRRTLDGFLERVNATGLLVIHRGKVVHERYFRGANEQSRFTSWSVAKSFISTLVGMALAEGRINSLDDSITDYVPSLAESGYAGVPVRHVLQMASGVDFDEVYGDRFSDINLFFWKVFVFGRGADAVMTDYGRARPSGEVLHYISINTQALGMLLRAVYGESIPSLIERKLWLPLGMGGDAFWNVDETGENGTAIAFCCLNARLRDFIKLGQLYLQHGRWDGKQILPESWVIEATTPGAPFLEPGVSPHPYGPRGYQYQWWVPTDYDREYFAAGVWGQYIYVSEPDDLVIARASVDPDYRPHMAESIAVFRAIADALQ